MAEAGAKRSKKTVAVGKMYRIIDPSATIASHLDGKSVEERIEECGRICYKTEDKITGMSAIGFGRKMVADMHNSVLEMAVVTYHVLAMGNVRKLREVSKYVVIDEYEEGYLITGSIRAFREAYMLCPQDTLIKGLVHAVAKRHPIFFEDMVLGDDNNMEQLIEKVELNMLDGKIRASSPKLWRRHRFVAVKFIVNRAVTHELVRHRPCAFLQESQRYCNYGQDRFDRLVTFIKPLFFPKGTPEYSEWLRSVRFSAKQYLKLLETSSPQAARTVLINSCKTEIIVFCNIVQWNHKLHMRTSPAAEPSMREVMIPLQAQMRELFSGESFDKRSPEGFLVSKEEAEVEA